MIRAGHCQAEKCVHIYLLLSLFRSHVSFKAVSSIIVLLKISKSVCPRAGSFMNAMGNMPFVALGLFCAGAQVMFGNPLYF